MKAKMIAAALAGAILILTTGCTSENTARLSSPHKTPNAATENTALEVSTSIMQTELNEVTEPTVETTTEPKMAQTKPAEEEPQESTAVPKPTAKPTEPASDPSEPTVSPTEPKPTTPAVQPTEPKPTEPKPTTPPTEAPTEATTKTFDISAAVAAGNAYAQSLGATVDYSLGWSDGYDFPSTIYADYFDGGQVEFNAWMCGQVDILCYTLSVRGEQIRDSRVNCYIQYNAADNSYDLYVFYG